MRRDDDDEALDLDEGDDEDTAPRRKRGGGSGVSLAKVLTVLRMGAWAALFLAVGCGGLLFCAALGKAQSAPQEAALGAVFATVFVALYVLTRCVDQVLDGAERVRSG